MWQVLMEHFRRYPAQEKVVRMMINQGLRINNGAICSGDVEIADTAIGRAAGVDRRIVRSTVDTILANPELAAVLTRTQPTMMLKEVAPRLGLACIEIIPENANQPGILAGVASAISNARISIRQCIVEDPAFTEEPKLYVVTQNQIPAALVPLMQAVPGVKGVAVFG